jgi:sodium-dependent dicarboxylate transporter 2/3/5
MSSLEARVSAEPRESGRRRSADVGLVAGPLAAVAVYLVLPESYVASGESVAFGHAGRATGAIGAWMAIWWMTEAISLYATALLPLVLLPLCGVLGMHETAAPYAHELIFLFMGGFVLALSMQRWGLDRRLSLHALRLFGTRPDAVVAGFMCVTAGLSMWVSNTATCVMMLPIALGVIRAIDTRPGDDGSEGRVASPFAVCLLLGVAYAASIGGVGTLVGTPPNLFLASYAKSHLGVEISFARWMGVGLPIVLLFLPVTWLLLTRVLFALPRQRVDGAREQLDEELRLLGAMSRGEWASLVVFASTALAWMTRPWLIQIEIVGRRPLAGLTDPGIAMTAALILFVIPVGGGRRRFAMDWPTASRLPWGLLLLFGGGLSLAQAIRTNGLGEYIGHAFTFLGAVPEWFCVLAVVSVMIFLTEITSNTATAASLIPILGGIAPAMGVEPLLLVVPAAVAASCAFMLPVATPPNAVVFGSGMIRLPQMVRAGLGLNLLGIVLITGLCYALTLRVLGL